MPKKIAVGLILILVVAIGIVWVVATRQRAPETRGEEQQQPASAAPTLSVPAFNQTKNTDAATAEAFPSDVIVYTLTAQNPSDQVAAGYVIEANISGVSDKSTLI